MELCQEKDRGKREEQQHGIQENEPRNAEPRHVCREIPHVSTPTTNPSAYTRRTTQHHERDQMTRPLTHTELDCRIPPQRNERDPIRRHDDPHRDIRHPFWIHLAALELERAVVASQKTSQADEHLTQRRVHVKVELALEVVRPKLAKVGFIPHDEVGEPNLVEAGPAREEGVDCWRDVFPVLLDEFGLGGVSQLLRLTCCGTKMGARWMWGVGSRACVSARC